MGLVQIPLLTYLEKYSILPAGSKVYYLTPRKSNREWLTSFEDCHNGDYIIYLMPSEKMINKMNKKDRKYMKNWEIKAVVTDCEVEDDHYIAEQEWLWQIH